MPVPRSSPLLPVFITSLHFGFYEEREWTDNGPEAEPCNRSRLDYEPHMCIAASILASGIDISIGNVSARSSRSASASASASASVCDILIGSGLAWPGLHGRAAPCALVWSGLVLSGLAWPGLAWSGLVWSGLVWSGLVWSGLGLAWPGLEPKWHPFVRSRNTKGLQNPTPGPSRNEKISAPKKTGNLRTKRTSNDIFSAV